MPWEYRVETIRDIDLAREHEAKMRRLYGDDEEYEKENPPDNDDGEDEPDSVSPGFCETLNTLGRDGWELVAMISLFRGKGLSDDVAIPYRCIFKRQTS